MEKSECNLVVRTIKNKDIPEKIKNQAINEILSLSDECTFSDHPRVSYAFTWQDMPSGHEFWRKIDNAKDKK